MKLKFKGKPHLMEYEKPGVAHFCDGDEKEVADDAKMTKEDVDRISRLLADEKKSEHQSLVELITTPEVVLAE